MPTRWPVAAECKLAGCVPTDRGVELSSMHLCGECWQQLYLQRVQSSAATCVSSTASGAVWFGRRPQSPTSGSFGFEADHAVHSLAALILLYKLMQRLGL
mmetsp:Transcript_32697/g.76658  ORF Transcript_32697/g.76658 Transcript_32697/m.76658 type:complete len:100 (-) Transcript_32697:36-335(-)